MNLKEDCFSTQTSESDFWAGFIAADGCIDEKKNQVRICLSVKDSYFIQYFKDWCQSSNKISGIQASYFSITSNKIVSDLKKYYNIVARKSLILQAPVRQSLSFIAGYFMGDGWIIKNKRRGFTLGFVGTTNMLEWIKSYFVDLSIAKVFKKRKISQLTYEGKKLILEISNRIFNNSPVYLDRKFDVYQTLLGEI